MSTRWRGSNSHVSHVCVSGRQMRPWAQTRALPADPVGFVRGRCVVARPEGPRGPQRWGGFCPEGWDGHGSVDAYVCMASSPSCCCRYKRPHAVARTPHAYRPRDPQFGSSEVQNQSVGRVGSFWRLREKPRSLPLTPVAVRPLGYVGPHQASWTISRS